MPKVAIVTVNYFGAADTRSCLLSVLSASPGSKIIVVDNSPNDPGVLDLKREFEADVTFIDSDSNLGFGGGNNLGISWFLDHTDCQYVLLLNNDARVQQGSIDTLVSCLDASPCLGAVAGLILVDGSDEVWFGSGAIDFARGGGRLVKPPYRYSGSYVESDFLSGAAMMIRREVLQKVGGFDPVFFMYEEDIDLSLRIRDAGWALGVCLRAPFHHRVQGSQRKDSQTGHKPRWSSDNPNFDFLVYHNVRNNIINIRKHAGHADLARILVIYPFWLALKTLNAARGRGLSAVRTVFRGIRDGVTQDLHKEQK